MKKLLTVSFALLITLSFATGCGKDEERAQENNTKKYEIAMEKYSKMYYDNFMNKSLDVPIVKLSALKKANESGQANYDLSDLEKCDDESYVALTVNKDTKVVEGYEHHLNCK